MEKVPFDPGIGRFAPCFSQDIKFVMGQILSVKSVNQRKFQFQFMYQQILNSFAKIIGFYEGCLLWAYYIKFSDNESEKEITGNHFLGQDVTNNQKFDFLYEINFLIEYLDKFEKDTEIFLNNPIKLDEHWHKIATTYKKFLEINNNFTATKTTKDLKVPDNFKPTITFDETKELFGIIIQTGQLEEFISSSVN